VQDDSTPPTRTAATERKIRAGFAVALAFLVGIGIVSWLSVAELKQNSRRVAHSHEVIGTIEALHATTIEAEGAQRGFIITGEEPFAADYARAAGRIEGLLAQLRDAVRNDPVQLARVDPLSDAVRARLARCDQIIQLRRSGGLAAVQTAIAQGRPGLALQTRVRTVSGEMTQRERARLVDNEKEAVRSANFTQAVISGGSGLAILFAVLALFAIRRDFAGRERAERELREFFDLALDIFVIATGDGRWLRASAAVTETLGYTIEEFLAHGYMDMIHPDDQLKSLQAVERQMRHGERITHFEARFRHKDGSWRVLSWRSMPRGDLMYGTARDVTDAAAAARALQDARDQLELRVEQRTAELAAANVSLRHSERRFRALLEHGSDSIALIDKDNRILYLSPAVAAVEGYTPEELVGQMGPENTHPDDLPLLEKYIAQLLANPGKPLPVLWRRRHKSGHWLWLEGVASNLLDDPAVGAIVTNYRDVSERMHADVRLREQLARLALLSRVTRAIGERQDLRSIFQVVVRTIEEELPVDFCCIFLYDAGENRLRAGHDRSDRRERSRALRTRRSGV
jgi:PAS domain S-box-containing protein